MKNVMKSPVHFNQLLASLPEVKEWVEKNCCCETTKVSLHAFIESSLYYWTVLGELSQLIHLHRSSEIEAKKPSA